MKKTAMRKYKSYERKNEQTLLQRKFDVVSNDKLLLLANQSQLIDAIKHTLIDKSLKLSTNVDTIASAINDVVTSDMRFTEKFFAHKKYLHVNAIINRIKAHLSCDSRHKESCYDKRNVTIVSTLK